MMPFSTKPSRREMIFGGIYLGLYAAILPWLLPVAVLALWPDLSAAQVNFIYFTLNFAAVTVIFRKFLFQTARDSLQNLSNTLWCGVAAYGANLFLTALVAAAILRLDPEFSNVNNDSLNTMFREERQLLFLGGVIMAPITEELLFRGLIFRGLYDRSPLAAHVVTMALFSLVHITGYIGHYSPLRLLLCFVQYLPASLCLNLAYRYGGTLLSPILMHLLTNLAAMSVMPFS